METGYGFLGHPASYDINQRLIEHSSRSTHARAALVGFLNTVLVAVTGIIFATLLGFMVGILRLSNNWLVSRLMTAYIEFTRNVPVLLHILLWYGIVVHVLPHPRQAIEPVSGLFLSNRGFYLPRPVFEDFAWVIPASLVATLVCVYLFARHARRVQERTGRIYPVLSMSLAAIVAVPVIAYFASGSPVSLDWPALKGFNYQGGIALKPEFFALWFALLIYTAAFIAEIVRSGIVAVSHGQTEAAYSLGIKPGWTMRLVIIPQALRVIVPPLIKPVPQPDQELFPGDRRRLHGPHRHHRPHIAEPDRPRPGVHVHPAHHIPAHFTDDFGVHELVQPAHPPGGAVRPWNVLFISFTRRRRPCRRP